jgi:hypothetical protein
MTQPENNQTPESMSAETMAYLILQEVDIKSGEGEASYRWALNYKAMLSAVKDVEAHGPRLPEDLKADLQIKFFNLFKVAYQKIDINLTGRGRG